MLRALLTGERDPAVLADLSRNQLRNKIPDLVKALEGRFTPHHKLLIEIIFDHIEYLERMIGRLDAEIDALFHEPPPPDPDRAPHPNEPCDTTTPAPTPFEIARDRLDTIPGVAKRAAEVIIAEIGIDMSHFPTAGHLASWAGMCPGNNVTGGKSRSGTTTKGDPWLRDVLVQCAHATSRTKGTYLSAQFWRLTKRIGKKKAAVAVGHSILVAAWHMLHDGVDYQDLGDDWFQRKVDDDHRKDRAIRELHDLGYRVTLDKAS
jgi:transposase